VAIGIHPGNALSGNPQQATVTTPEEKAVAEMVVEEEVLVEATVTASSLASVTTVEKQVTRRPAVGHYKTKTVATPSSATTVEGTVTPRPSVGNYRKKVATQQMILRKVTVPTK
jgi:hypothetical protein